MFGSRKQSLASILDEMVQSQTKSTKMEDKLIQRILSKRPDVRNTTAKYLREQLEEQQ